MPQAIQLTTAKVKYTPGTPRDTQYGPRINAVLTLPDGTEAKLWGDPDDASLLALKKGESVQLAKNAKGNWQLASTAPVEAPSTPNNGNGTVTKPNQATQMLSDDEKRAIAAKVTENAKLMKYCLQQAREHCSEYLETSEDLRAVATTLFLQAVKR
jgi:hypothetical protein